MRDWVNYTGPCTCGPNGPFHKRSCPCAIMYREKRETDLASCPSTPEHAERVARRLVRRGYVQFSRRYRLVGKGEDCPLNRLVELDVRTFEAFRRIAND